MPEISLTDFVDFSISTPHRQLSKVREIANRGPYDPRFDFWKPMRECIQDHADDEGWGTMLADLTDPKKKKRYPGTAKMYRKFVAKQNDLKWFKPPAGTWSYQGLVVRVNPELGLELGDHKHVVKLYFKDEKLTKPRLKVVFEMIRLGLKLQDGIVPAVLDIAKGRLILPKGPDDNLLPLLEAQALAFVHLWKAVNPDKL